MKKLTTWLQLPSDDELFNYFHQNLKLKGITQWDYFVNWEKVKTNIAPYEVELNLLNVLIGKTNIEDTLTQLILKHPSITSAIPILLAIRFQKKNEGQINILTEPKLFKYEQFDLSISTPSSDQAQKIAELFMKTGLGDLLCDRSIKNLVDYATGVEVGLDSNARKNRGGHQMENLVKPYIKKLCQEKGYDYLAEANAKAIKEKWGIEIQVDKSSRRIDFVINANGKLFFIEVNFYGGSGSKLKSTATEYIKMNEYWNNQGIPFTWITDGAGWLTTLRPLREYFDKADYLLNLDMLSKGILGKIIIQHSSHDA